MLNSLNHKRGLMKGWFWNVTRRKFEEEKGYHKNPKVTLGIIVLIDQIKITSDEGFLLLTFYLNYKQAKKVKKWLKWAAYSFFINDKQQHHAKLSKYLTHRTKIVVVIRTSSSKSHKTDRFPKKFSIVEDNHQQLQEVQCVYIKNEQIIS